MIKRTLYFGHPAYLSLRQAQLVIRLPEVETNDRLPEAFKNGAERTVPIEDIGVMVLDHPRITLTQGVLEALLDRRCAVLTCDRNHLPVGWLLPLCGNATQNERFRYQLEASQPLRKQLWQQTVQAKIAHQAAVLHRNRGVSVRNMQRWVAEVRSGDPDNLEARAAAYYWSRLFPIEGFRRDREGPPPNHLLNYGYAVLRAVTARALAISGLLPVWGIHHRNRYNAYCLADDIMEPYRPYVDQVVYDLVADYGAAAELTVEVKTQLLSIPVLDVRIDGERRPLQVAMGQTTASLYRCFKGELRKIAYPAAE